MAAGPLYALTCVLLSCWLCVASAKTLAPYVHKFNQPSVNKVNWHNSYPPERTAYVMFHYEHQYVTQFDEAHLIGVRVLVKSLQASGSVRDIVVLVNEHTRSSTRDLLRSYGCIVTTVPPLRALQPQLQELEPLCEEQYSVLHLWNPKVLNYERVVYFEADVLVLLNNDELFLCGEFCAFFNSLTHFSLQLMVVRPDADQFLRLLGLFVKELGRLNQEWAWSVPGVGECRQQSWLFLVRAFWNIEAAPLFDPSQGQSHDRKNRLDLSYCLNTILYYEVYSWHLLKYRSFSNKTVAIPAFALGYPQEVLKPWDWFPAAWFELDWYWQDARLQLLDEDWSWFGRMGWVLVALVVAFAVFGLEAMADRVHHARPTLRRTLHEYAYWILHKTRRVSVIAVGAAQVVSLCLVWLIKAFIPLTTPPHYGWPLFLAYHTLCSYIVLYSAYLLVFGTPIYVYTVLTLANNNAGPLSAGPSASPVSTSSNSSHSTHSGSGTHSLSPLSPQSGSGGGAGGSGGGDTHREKRDREREGGSALSSSSSSLSSSMLESPTHAKTRSVVLSSLSSLSDRGDRERDRERDRDRSERSSGGIAGGSLSSASGGGLSSSGSTSSISSGADATLRTPHSHLRRYSITSPTPANPSPNPGTASIGMPLSSSNPSLSGLERASTPSLPILPSSSFFSSSAHSAHSSPSVVSCLQGWAHSVLDWHAWKQVLMFWVFRPAPIALTTSAHHTPHAIHARQTDPVVRAALLSIDLRHIFWVAFSEVLLFWMIRQDFWVQFVLKMFITFVVVSVWIGMQTLLWRDWLWCIYFTPPAMLEMPPTAGLKERDRMRWQDDD